jgi:hypothetical protein
MLRTSLRCLEKIEDVVYEYYHDSNLTKIDDTSVLPHTAL